MRLVSGAVLFPLMKKTQTFLEAKNFYLKAVEEKKERNQPYWSDKFVCMKTFRKTMETEKENLGVEEKRTREKFLLPKKVLFELIIAFFSIHSVPLGNKQFSPKRGEEKEDQFGLEFNSKLEAYLGFLNAMDNGDDSEFEEAVSKVLSENEKQELKKYREGRSKLGFNARVEEDNDIASEVFEAIDLRDKSDEKRLKSKYERKVVALSTFRSFFNKDWRFKRYKLRYRRSDVCPKCTGLSKDIVKYRTILDQLKGREPIENEREQLDILLNNVRLGKERRVWFFICVIFLDYKKKRVRTQE